MKEDNAIKEIGIILFSSLIMAISVSFYKTELFLISLVSLTTILLITFLVKSMIAYHYELEIETDFMKFERYGKKKKAHLKTPIPYFLFTLFLAPLSFPFFGILETKTKARTERAVRRHRRDRFSKVTEKDEAKIAFWGIITLLVLATIGKITNVEQFSLLSIYYALWNTMPFSKLDGSKILFGKRGLWYFLVFILLVFITIFFSF